MPVYRGTWHSWEAFSDEEADMMLEQYTGKENSFLTSYFDYEKWSRDLSYDYNSWDIGGVCYVFSNH